MKNRKAIVIGWLRNTLVAVGSLWFFNDPESWQGITAFGVSMASLAWAVSFREGWGVALTIGRKVLSALPGVLLGLGWIKPEMSEMIIAFIAPVMAMVFSYINKKNE